jgi:type I restriction-modification system DNA methylase subunit
VWRISSGTFKRGKYQDVILPLTVLRRIDCVLAPTKAKVLTTRAKFKDRLDNLDPQLRKASGFAFYNTSLYDFIDSSVIKQSSTARCVIKLFLPFV